MRNIKFYIGIIIFLSMSCANATLKLDRTRVIYNEENTGTSLVVENTDGKDPFLAQAWIENAAGEKIKEPLVALPLLQRIEPNQKKQIRITSVKSDAKLPSDRESLFYFNVVGVPPKSKLDNVVEIVIQSRLKLFYRPKGLPKYPDHNWQDSLSVEKKGNSIVLHNPTPYHVVIININNTKNSIKNFPEIILEPFADKVYKPVKSMDNMSKIAVVYIDDFGAAKKLEYSCGQTACQLKTKS